MRFPLDVVRAVRAVVPRGVPLGARITGSDWADGGLTPDDAVTLGGAASSTFAGLRSAISEARDSRKRHALGSC